MEAAPHEVIAAVEAHIAPAKAKIEADKAAATAAVAKIEAMPAEVATEVEKAL
jgi:hypothetical protein